MIESGRMAKRQKNPAAVTLGRLGGRKGGSKGGKARMAKLTADERRALALKAIRTRWKKAKKKAR
jgi:hypothetical protein